MITSIQITNIEVFAFAAVLIFKLISRKVLFIIRKDNRKFHGKKIKFINSWNAKFPGYFGNA